MRPETETELSLNDETGQKMSILRLHWDSHWSLLPPLMGRRMIYMPWKEFYFMWVRLVFLTFRANSAISSWSSLFRFPLFGYFWLNYSQDFNNLWILRKRLINTGIYDGCRDRELSRLRNFSDVETKTHRDWEISLILRLRLIKTENFLGCRDQDSSKLENLMDVETKTSQDSLISDETKLAKNRFAWTISIIVLLFCSCSCCFFCVLTLKFNQNRDSNRCYCCYCCCCYCFCFLCCCYWLCRCYNCVSNR